jgi:hypothetical protein
MLDSRIAPYSRYGDVFSKVCLLLSAVFVGYKMLKLKLMNRRTQA